MKYIFLIIILTSGIYSCNNINKSKSLPTKVGNRKTEKINLPDTTKKNADTNNISELHLKLDGLLNRSSNKMILVSSSQLSPGKTINVDGIDFDLVTTNNDTIYLATNDKKFITPEGFSVGTKFSELPKDIQTNLTKEPGWAYYYKLPSGWTLGFCEGNSCTSNYPNMHSKVQWIFKRR